MDPIISKLNQMAQERVKSSIQTPDYQGGKPKIETSFDQTLTDKLMDKLKENDMSGAQDMTAISADDVQVKTAGNEIGESQVTTQDRMFDMFKGMNKDMTSLDSAIETLTTPGVSMSPRQLLSLQAGVANTSIMAEAFSKFTDGVARGIQTIVSTQVG